MSGIDEQMELIARAASSQIDRAMFIGNPIEYAESLGVTIDNNFAAHMRERMVETEGQLAAQGFRNPYLKKLDIKIKDPGWIDPPPPDFEAGVAAGNIPRAATVLVAAAVVSAAASVVSAASTTYMATKWLMEHAARTDIPDLKIGIGEIVSQEPFLRPDIRMIEKALKGRKGPQR